MAAPTPINWPRKTREFQNVLMDSTRWNGFEFRDGDIVIGTWAKSGTTWTQQIVGQLLYRGAEKIPATDKAPWLDLRLIPLEAVMGQLQAETHRRYIKTHLPLDALVFSPKAKYLYIGRDGRDTLWSWHNHMRSIKDEMFAMVNQIPGRVGPPVGPPPEDVVEHFRQWLDGDGHPLANFWEHYQGWFDARHLPNVQLVHFNQLKADLPGQMRRIANFLEIEVDESLWPAMVEHCTFEYMKKNSSDLGLLMGFFKRGGDDFIHKGTNGRWRDVLPAADNERYEQRVRDRLTPECARWMATGEVVD